MKKVRRKIQMCFVSVDFDGLELRTLAEVMIFFFGKSVLADILNSGKDPHVMLGATLMGISYAEAERLKKLSDPEFKKYRDAAKPGNFGLPVGMGIDKLKLYAKQQFGIVLTDKMASDLYDGYFQTFPDMRKYHNRISKMVSEGGQRNVFGREETQMECLVSKRLRGKVGFTDMANGFFQSLAADGAAAALFEVTRRMYSEPASKLFGWRIVAFIHDEILMEGPLEDCDAAGRELAEVMVEEMQRYVPHMAKSLTASPAVMLRWSKQAEPYYENDKLVPWEFGAIKKFVAGLRWLATAQTEKRAA